MSALLAREFVREGHEVVVVAETQGQEEVTAGYGVARNLPPGELFKLVRWADVYFHNHPLMRKAWPLLFIDRPWVVTFQTWLPGSEKGGSLTGRLRRTALNHAERIYISAAVAASTPFPGTIIHNPYDETMFKPLSGVRRNLDLVFVGRLGADKGCNVLIDAVKVLRDRGLELKVSIVGGGPEEPRLRMQVERHGLSDWIEFLGVQREKALAETLNAHRVMVVPSVWNEPFGVVALEGIACGCVVVGSSGGGLPDAIGPCGLTFRNGDPMALAGVLAGLFGDTHSLERFRGGALDHLAVHTSAAIAQAYLSVFHRVIASS